MYGKKRRGSGKEGKKKAVGILFLPSPIDHPNKGGKGKVRGNPLTLPFRWKKRGGGSNPLQKGKKTSFS